MTPHMHADVCMVFRVERQNIHLGRRNEVRSPAFDSIEPYSDSDKIRRCSQIHLPGTSSPVSPSLQTASGLWIQLPFRAVSATSLCYFFYGSILYSFCAPQWKMQMVWNLQHSLNIISLCFHKQYKRKINPGLFKNVIACKVPQDR